LSLPPGYRGPADQGRDSRLCARCGDPIHRLAESTSRALGLDNAWLDSLEAVDPEALEQLTGYLHQLATLWHWTQWALDGGARPNGIDEIRTHQRGGDPTSDRISPAGSIADAAAIQLRNRCSAEAKRLRDATLNLRRYLADCELVDSPNLERERRRHLRDEHGRLVP
jgi:hypothetical protein